MRISYRLDISKLGYLIDWTFQRKQFHGLKFHRWRICSIDRKRLLNIKMLFNEMSYLSIEGLKYEMPYLVYMKCI